MASPASPSAGPPSPGSRSSAPIILVKIGGSTLGADDTSIADVARLQDEGYRPVVVHGGGAVVTTWMAKMGIRAEFAGGLRVTDDAGLEVATAVLAGLVNKALVRELQAHGAKVVGVAGADGAMLRGHVGDPSLGHVASTVDVDPALAMHLIDGGYTPVIAPLAIDAGGGEHLLNVNADTAAGAIAIAMGADALVFLTDVDGVLDSDGRLLRRVLADQAETMIAGGIIKGGMIPKVRACIASTRAGVSARIVNGTKAGALSSCLGGVETGTTVV